MVITLHLPKEILCMKVMLGTLNLTYHNFKFVCKFQEILLSILCSMVIDCSHAMFKEVRKECC
jgi:hypothetical protein